MLDLRPHFSLSLGAAPERLHFAAHSHHPRPDVTRAAQLASWDDAARLLDAKWEHVLGPGLAGGAAPCRRHCGLPDPSTIVFAPNTRTSCVRILSPCRRPAAPHPDHGWRIPQLARQLARWRRRGWSWSPHPERARPRLPPRFARGRARASPFDLLWSSEVFFRRRRADRPSRARRGRAAERALVIDGYHAFMARPVDSRALAGRAFYLAGGYKYAMAGRGPASSIARRLADAPRSTGCMRASASLAEGEAACPMPRMAGASWAPPSRPAASTAERRMDWLAGLGLDAAAIHAHAHACRPASSPACPTRGSTPPGWWCRRDDPARGNFLAFDLEDAEAWQARLAAAGIVTDRRGRRLRFGFGLYQTGEEVTGCSTGSRASPDEPPHLHHGPRRRLARGGGRRRLSRQRG
jgi:hypothetical protein